MLAWEDRVLSIVLATSGTLQHRRLAVTVSARTPENMRPTGHIFVSTHHGFYRQVFDCDGRRWTRSTCWLCILEYFFIAGMVEKKTGRITNIISEAGRIGEANMAVYSGAKAAIGGFAKALAREHGRHAITVNSVALGAVSHEGIKDGPLNINATVENNELLKKMLNVYPISKGVGRLSRPGDISGVVAFLASGQALFVTGQTLGASGGFVMN
jgi:NAD(P)-dependent dehydrogenase (short-subunit alcohol dehydrogenase family)